MKARVVRTRKQGFFQKLTNSFQYAFSGLAHLLRTQQNTWIHLTFTVLTITGAGFLHFKIWKWIILVLVIGIVWTAEAFNTSLEHLTDLASPRYHQKAKIVKDVGAAAVLLTAIMAFVVGLLLFIPPIINLFYPKK